MLGAFEPFALPLIALAAAVFTSACSHPINIVGNGDVYSASGKRDCLLEDFLARRDNCTKNYVVDEYIETYYAVPRPGWKFERWTNYCLDTSENHCTFNVPTDTVQRFWGGVASPLQPVFTRIDGSDIVVVDGKEWIQVDIFYDLSWSEIDSVCPSAAGGVCTNAGVLNGHNMTGWTWASVSDIQALLNHYIGSDALQYDPINRINHVYSDGYYSESSDWDTAWANQFHNAGWRGSPVFDPTIAAFQTNGWLRTRPNTQDAYRADLFDVRFDDDGFFGGDSIRAPNYALELDFKSSSLGGWFFREP